MRFVIERIFERQCGKIRVFLLIIVIDIESHRVRQYQRSPDYESKIVVLPPEPVYVDVLQRLEFNLAELNGRNQLRF